MTKIAKLKRLQKNKPTIEQQSGWKYILHDGNNWRQFYYPSSISAIKRMENEVTNSLNWSEHLTIVRNIPPFDIVFIKKMKFPDGRVWDSKLKEFKYAKKC